MSDLEADVLITGGDGPRHVRISSYLDASAVETADREANAWIKGLRGALVDGRPFRTRFAHRGDSLWWFSEIYLHKRGTVAAALKTILALEAMLERECPVSMRLLRGDRLARRLAPQAAARFGVRYRGPRAPRPFESATAQRLLVAGRSALHAGRAALATLGSAARGRPGGDTVEIAAFVHRAFLRHDAGPRDDVAADRYIGPVLEEIARALPASALRVVGLGPPTSFAARRWWRAVLDFASLRPPSPPPVGRYAAWAATGPSRALWRQRASSRRALLASAGLKRAARIREYDLWPLLRDDLVGLPYLQWPWAARAMDEAGAALDALRPGALVTYAEAGGWGRALLLEARRRRIATAALQHGFIYRHWLNYLHEPDEMVPAPGNPADRGFPRPDLTLVDDHHAAHHLIAAGRLPPASVHVTGSPRLDELILAVRARTAADVDPTRAAVGAKPGQHLVLVVSKFSQIGSSFPRLVEVVSTMPDVHLVVKPHPAETEAPYARQAAGVSNVAVVAPSSPLPPLVSAARLIVTVNSTVAVDAIALGVPALVLTLPNNLTPFVESHAMAGTASDAELAPTLRALLEDEAYRARLAQAGRAMMARHGTVSDGASVARSAEAVLALLEEHAGRRRSVGG